MLNSLVQQLLLLIVVYFCTCALGGNFLRAEETKETSALFSAMKEGDSNAVQRLIDANVDVNARNSNNISPLYFAARKGDAKIVKSLLDAGADTDARVFATLSAGITPIYEGTALHVAAALNHIEVTQTVNAKAY